MGDTFAQIIIHKADKPDAAVDFLDANGLASRDVLRLIFLRDRLSPSSYDSEMCGREHVGHVLQGLPLVIPNCWSWPTWAARDVQADGSTFSRSRFDPDTSAVRFDNSPAHCEPNSRTGDFGPMQALERLEDLLVILRLDADAIVPDANDPLQRVKTARPRFARRVRHRAFGTSGNSKAHSGRPKQDWVSLPRRQAGH